MSNIGFDKDVEKATKKGAGDFLITETGLGLRQFLKEQELTQSGLAKKLGKKQSHISLAASGEQNMTLRTLAEIAWAGDFDVEVVFTARDDEDTGDE